MLMLISPAKTLDFDSPSPTAVHSQPGFLDHSAELIAVLRDKSPADIASLMSISDALAVLNAGRFQQWQPPFGPHNAKQAVMAFMGDVYEGLAAATLPTAAVEYLQQHLRILSGLYGLLRPLDLIQPYRLEMGSRLHNARGSNLYQFWGERLTEALNAQLADAGHRTVVNLASEEYFKAIKAKQLQATVIHPVFQDLKNGHYKIISFYAKRARGLMARWAAQHRVDDAEALKNFDSEGYAFDAAASDATHWVFRRDPATH